MNFLSRFKELASAIEECSYASQNKNVDQIQAMSIVKSIIQNGQAEGGIIYVIGNGGSAGIASHFCNDLMKALKIPSQTLFDSNLMTCLSNDIGYDQVFSYPLERLLKPNDVLVAISSSGKSENILKAVRVAQVRNVPIITLSGFLPDNPLRSTGLLNFYINRIDYGLVETAHFFLLHTIIDAWSKTNPTAEYAKLANELYYR